MELKVGTFSLELDGVEKMDAVSVAMTPSNVALGRVLSISTGAMGVVVTVA